MIPEYLVYLSIPLSLIGTGLYLREMFYGEARPNRVSFLLWAVAPLIGTAIALKDGVGLSIIPIFMAGFNPLVIFIASFLIKKGYWKLGALDYICGALSVLAMIFWLVADSPSVAVTLAILSDLLASIPTIAKIWKEPRSEPIHLYILSIVSNIIGLLVIRNWNYMSASFGLYLIALNTTIVLSIRRSNSITK